MFSIFIFFFLYNKPLQQSHNPLQLPSELSGSNNSSARGDPQQVNTSSCRFWLDYSNGLH